ncbi:MAG TPA: efflux RND transporter periplasmic adaptor subunit [Ferruginibacter sp.]|nr:efflux RND transporter periplasmic adaptor subunit [Ferruginibacter sp.]HRO16852.1 efflux RND transporter periplasmic adaptor subunit [Ferruginibacter sp.]HRQ20224.1 efflux RND transporter periplasmic adaptor subunit [Ferruginibacter sp.]
MFRYLFFFIAAIISISCNAPRQDDPVAVSAQEHVVVLSDAQLKNTNIQVAQLEKQMVSSVLRVNGILEVPPSYHVKVNAPMGGYLKSTQLMEGVFVKQGEILATMEDVQYIQMQQDYLTAKSQLFSVEKDYARQKELNQSKAGSDKVFEKIQTEYNSLRILIKSLEQKLRLIHINPVQLNEQNISGTIRIPSPISGYVSKVHVQVGQYLTASDVIFDIIDPNQMHLSVTVFEKDVHKLYAGQKLEAFTNANPSARYPGEIFLIGKDISPEGSLKVMARLQHIDQRLLPGMYINADIHSKATSALVIPEDGLVAFGNKHYVFEQLEKGRFKMIEVLPGERSSGAQQITFQDSTVYANKPFVVSGAYTLLMQLKNTEEE